MITICFQIKKIKNIERRKIDKLKQQRAATRRNVKVSYTIIFLGNFPLKDPELFTREPASGSEEKRVEFYFLQETIDF